MTHSIAPAKPLQDIRDLLEYALALAEDCDAGLTVAHIAQALDALPEYRPVH